MTPRRLLVLFVLLAACSSLHAACPCVSIFCPCCLDRCRIGFVKVAQDGCRDRGGLESYTVVMKIGRAGTEVWGFQQGRMAYDQARSVWESGSRENAPALSDAARELLGYSDATFNSVIDGTWASKHVTAEMARQLGAGKPLLLFAPLGTTGNPLTAKGAVVGVPVVLDLMTGKLHGSDKKGQLVETNQIPEARAAWLNAYDGRRLSDDNPLAADFGVDTINPDLYSWRSCTDSDTCSLLFLIAVALMLPAMIVWSPFSFLIAGIGVASLGAQSLGWYCGVYPCNKQCTYGTIAAETRFWVRLDAAPPGDGGGGGGGGGSDDASDIIINSMSLIARVDMVPLPEGGYGFSSKHYRGDALRSDGTPPALLFKGTIVDLGESGLDLPRGEEDPRTQFRLRLVPPSKPSELLPGPVFGIERRN